MIGHKTGIRSLWNTEERQQNDPSSHKDGGKQGCHYLSIGMTDWTFTLIASSLLRTDRNLGTPPTKQETWFRTYLKSPSIFCECLLEPDGWTLLSQARRCPKQARSINHAKKKSKEGIMWILFQFMLCPRSSRRQQFEQWLIKVENLGVSQEYSMILKEFLKYSCGEYDKVGCLNLWAPSSRLASDHIQGGSVSHFSRLVLFACELDVQKIFSSSFISFLSRFTDGRFGLHASAGTRCFNKIGGRPLSRWLLWEVVSD